MHLYNSVNTLNATDGTFKDGESGKCYVTWVFIKPEQGKSQNN